MQRNIILGSLVILGGVFLLSGCGTTSESTAQNFTEPAIDQPGRTIMRYRGPEVEVLVDYKFAAQSLGDGWLILNVAVTGRESRSEEIARRSIKVKMPDGRKVSIPEHKEFTRAYPEYQSAARRAALASSPLDFTKAGRRSCDLAFQPLPGTGIALESVHVNFRRICQGLLYSPIPGGVQPGNWTFIIELEEGEVLFPFVFEP